MKNSDRNRGGGRSPGKDVSPRRRLLHTFLVYFLLSEVLIVGGALYVVTYFSKDLPGTERLERIPEEQSLSTIIYSSDGVELRTIQKEKRFWVTYDELPQCLVDAVLSAEDKRFFKHWGISLPDIARALVADLKSVRIHFSDKFPYFLDFTVVQGGSTITQQLAKNLYFGTKQILTRKIREAITSIQIEKTYSKEEILEMYLNKMDFSNNAYGIQAASRLYFAKDVKDLNVAEAALLAGMLQNSYKYNPRSRHEKIRRNALHRRNTVLRMMARNGKIPWWRVHEEIAKPIELAVGTVSDYGKAPYFVDYVRSILEKRYGKEFVETSGWKVYTTLDYRLQEIAEQALESHLDRIQKAFAGRIRYERPPGLSHFEAIRDSLKKTAVQGALVAIDIKTGKILAMVGGREYSQHNWFNRAVQARRSAGSSFKPFVYTAALDNGWRCCDTINDAYWSIKLPDGTVWEPRNFEDEYLGILSLRDGFKLSQNMVAVKLVNDMENRGIGPRLVKKYARAMGITTPIPEVPSIAIGTPEVRLIEMVSAYTVFPKHGIKTEYFAIQRVIDKNGTVIHRQDEGAPEEVLNPEVASLMLTMLRSVTTEGTGRIMIPASGMGDRPCAGKTGTGSDYKDAWFIGFTPYIACGVWVGFDSEETKLMKPYNTGATAAIPVWGEFMRKASELLGYPKDDFKLEGDISIVPVCRDSYLRATPYCPKDRVYNEYFISGTEIQEFCDIHGPQRKDSRIRGFRRNKNISRRVR